jgi:heptaprenyl diphosphate synthase/octaprenyl-diphosphate synthase
MAEAGAHIVQAGGKRLRAALALLAARLGHYNPDQARHAAATVELIHTASLVHDDLVDGSRRRRGRITVHSGWDNDVALMLGDYLFALAAAEMALCDDQRIVACYAHAVQATVTGELHPVTDVTPLHQAVSQYFFKTGAKTAALFEAACKAGMLAGGGSDEEVTAMGRYGYEIGLAFQIVDDILDFTGSTGTLGKPAGNDVRQGTLTLPLIYAFAGSKSPAMRAVADAALSDDQVQQVVEEVQVYGGTAKAWVDAEGAVRRALSHLERFPFTSTRQALTDLAYFILERQH